MSYTKELEEWTKQTRGHSELSVAQMWDTYLVLSAFAKLVREEGAVKGGDNPYLLKEARIGAAFNALVERFGLEERK